MLYIYYGNDREGLIKKTESFLKSLFSTNPDLVFEKFDIDNFNLGKLRDLSESESLFGNRTAILLDNVLKENEEVFLDLAKLQVSKNIFIIREDKILKAEVSLLRKYADKIEGINLTEGKKKEVFNIFLFSDAIGERNKKNAWILYQKAIFSGLVPEEIFWKLVAPVRTMLIAKKTTAEASGLHPYAYKKAKSFLRNFKEGELENLSEELVIGYHEARLGKGEIETLLEKTILKL
ncbi:MAG: hypothetical protein M3Q24_00970 [bacterium]|nr:hypothetical protein [bacterium]